MQDHKILWNMLDPIYYHLELPKFQLLYAGMFTVET